MRLCVIPARGGSKRIPRKNIKSFCGQSMIGYSIKAAIASECFDEIIVSTDDAEIAEIAKSFGASVPFVRPKSLANDYTTTIPVIKHAIEWFNTQGQSPLEVCCLYATAPFVRADAIRKAYEQMKREKADYCFTVTSFAFPIQRAFKTTQENRVEMFYPNHFETRSQDLEKSYHDAGQFYWGKAEAFKQTAKTTFFKGRHAVYFTTTLSSRHRYARGLEACRINASGTREKWRAGLKAVFRVDASLTMGAGHVLRCLTLAQELKENGEDVDFICRKHKGGLIYISCVQRMGTSNGY